MKRIIWALLAYCLLWCSAALAQEIPAQVLEPLEGRFDAGYSITAYSYAPGASRAHFVLSRNGRNQLAIVRLEDGKYELELLATGALRQGDEIPELKCDDDDSLYVVYRDDNGWEDQYNYFYTGGKWLLDGYVIATARDSCHAFAAYDGRLSYNYFVDLESERHANIYGVYQREVKHLNVDSLPQNLQEAREKLTQPPEIPDGGLNAQSVKFTSGKKYAVYSGPGEDYLRAADGKAAVSTNDWIQVFGTDGSWVLIQYDITSDQMRFGYIKAEALPGSAQVDELYFRPVDAYLSRRAALTDDPLNSQSALLTLPEGAWVAWLATMGEWAYVESSTGDMIRGFIPLSAITTYRVFDLANHSWDGNAAALSGALTVQPDGVVTLVVDAWQTQGGQIPARFQVYNETTMEPIFTAEPDALGGYQGQGMLSNGWSVLICPVYADGKVDLNAGVSVQW